MFFKKIEFILLQIWQPSLQNLQSISVTLISNIFAFIISFIIITWSSGIFIRTILYALSFFFITYWFLSIFIYLYKKSQFGVFTRIIQRFWKRALWLFWLIELFLFFIYLFLAIISPQEVAYMLDNTQLILDYSLNLKNFFIITFNALIIILLINIQLLLHKTNSFKILLNVSITVLLIRAAFDDFLQFYSINNFYSGYSWSHAKLESESDNLTVYKTTVLGVWEQEVVEIKNRTILHYLYLLIFLKLWHTVFILMVYIFLENATLRTNNLSYNTLAANLQNFYFLMFFNYILKITLLKAYLGYFGTYVFYWFFINYNIYDFSYIYALFSLDYLKFLWNDLI